MLSLGCTPSECACETSVCTCDGKPPPKITPTTTEVMKTEEHVCEDDEVKLSRTHALVIPCNRGCGDYWCMERCRCVDRGEWDAFQADAPRPEPAEPAKMAAPKKKRPVKPDLKDPFGEPTDPVDKYLEDGPAE
jgi:hypothetical protein